MERYEIGMGDFLKNAGISGLVYLLKIAGAEENVVYGITEDGQKLWLDADLRYRLTGPIYIFVHVQNILGHRLPIREFWIV